MPIDSFLKPVDWSWLSRHFHLAEINFLSSRVYILSLCMLCLLRKGAKVVCSRCPSARQWQSVSTRHARVAVISSFLLRSPARLVGATGKFYSRGRLLTPDFDSWNFTFLPLQNPVLPTLHWAASSGFERLSLSLVLCLDLGSTYACLRITFSHLHPFVVLC